MLSLPKLKEYAHRFPHSLSPPHTKLSHLHQHTHARAHSHTRAVLSKAPLLDLSHLAKEVPVEARESQRETKERRTVEGEERIGEQRTGLRKERHSAL